MKQISITKQVVGMTTKELWDYLTAIDKYPQYVPFVKKTIMVSDLAKDSVWYDVTSILWIPMKFRHRTLAFAPQKEMTFAVSVPFRGYMWQQYAFLEKEEKIIVTASAKFDLGNKILNVLVEPILEKRLRKMIEGSIASVQKQNPHTQVTEMV